MATAKKTPEEPTRTLRVFDSQGSFEVTIPADWKVTFGGFNQGGKYPDGTAALRIYEGAENRQRACFRGVTGFFDTALPIKRSVVTESGETTWENGPDGYEKSTKVKRSVAEVPFR